MISNVFYVKSLQLKLLIFLINCHTVYDFFKVLEIVFDFYLCPVYTVDYTFSKVLL